MTLSFILTCVFFYFLGIFAMWRISLSRLDSLRQECASEIEDLCKSYEKSFQSTLNEFEDSILENSRLKKKLEKLKKYIIH